MKKLKYFARDAFAQTLYDCGASRLSRTPPGRLLILTLHRVLPLELRDRYPLPGLAISPDELRWVLSCVVRHFAVDTVTGAFNRLHSGKEAGPFLAVSFDDGQLDNLEHAVPVLDEFGIKASFYVPTDFVGGQQLLWHDAAGFAWADARLDGRERAALIAEYGCGAAFEPGAQRSVDRFLAGLKTLSSASRGKFVAELSRRYADAQPAWARLMTWEEIAQLHAAGHEIGAHGCTHELLPQLDAEQQRAEIEGSRAAIGKSIGSLPRSFCYPNGSFDEQTLAAVEAAGYDNAVTTHWGINDRASARFELARCDINPHSLVDRKGVLSLPRLSLRLSGYQPGLGRLDGRLPASA